MTTLTKKNLQNMQLLANSEDTHHNWCNNFSTLSWILFELNTVVPAGITPMVHKRNPLPLFLQAPCFISSRIKKNVQVRSIP